jgi:signal transduction histidine kinase
MKNKKSTAPAKKKLPAKKTITTSVVKKANLANVDKLKAENLQLRDAVKRRTVELDQKNRELAIEAAMEKVRARSLAMQKPEELAEVAEVLRNEMGALGVEELETSSIYMVDETKGTTECWYAIKDIRVKGKKLVTDYMTLRLHETWVGKQMQRFHRSKHTRTSILMQGENRKEWINYCAGKSSVLKGYYGGEIPERTYHLLKFSNGYMGAASPGAISAESWDLLQRATSVFSFASKRFSDLQKAEAQTREAQIEAALERVRSRSMAMHKSEELREVIQLVFEQFRLLNFKIDSAQFDPNYKETDDFNMWTAVPGQPYPTLLHIPYLDNPAFNGMKEAKKRGLSFITQHLSFEEKNQFFRHFFQHFKHIPAERQKLIFDSPGIYRAVVFMENVSLAIQNYSNTAYTEEENEVLKRFGKTFEQVYIRLLDLQKAEAQAREAQIEAALERVRSKTMAMHNSQDVGESVATLFVELVKMGLIGVDDRCGIGIMQPHEMMEAWTASKTQDGKSELTIGHINMTLHPLLVSAYGGWVEKKEFNQYILEGEDILRYYDAMRNQSNYKFKRDYFSQESRIVHTDFYFNEGCLYVFSKKEFLANSNPVFLRFVNVFGQTYRRYLDLQKAETQAKEATIEASLEKVRGKAMAMHTSNDLLSTAGVVFTELKKLGINSFRGGIALIDKESRFGKMYSATSSEEGETLSLNGTILLDGHPVLSEIGDCMIGQLDYFPVLKGELLVSYITHVSAAFNSPLIKSNYDEWYGCFLPYSEGGFYVWSDKPFTESEVKILHRFNAIVDLTFRRYLELQRAEANALEAVRSASLDRVRAEIASMRTKQDLERITPLIWKELTTLGIPFVRCGVFIMDEKEELIHTFLSTPDGKAIAAFHVPYGSTPLGGAIEFWRERKMYLTHWGIKEYAEFADAFIDKNETEKRVHYLSSVPNEGIHLHLLPFIQGMLYVGNTTALTDDNLHLVQSVADAFSTAYARYEDFNKIESAKAQVEKTLVDLKAAQSLLVQSEKMASLGELTAGIAHEIQNPLNFVNNFSEVSTELIAELRAERAKAESDRDKELEEELLSDISTNMEKINHHGKRAGGIVSGMLQHSRTSTGVKEPTDINALADEYLRLAYHGLRAKDKTFNAKFETDFDEGIGKVNVISQDIGRVILNLITNAFYVVNEKSHQNISGYEPTVTVSTRLESVTLAGITGITKIIKIIVKDNGNGIPQKILDKIFQPFFTTKPTGQGTGLGLSLSYDIVKAHGGEIKVNTKENEGTTFTIEIPA